MEPGRCSWSHAGGSGDSAWRARCSYGPRHRNDGPRARPVVEAARGCLCAKASILAAVAKPASRRSGVSLSCNGLPGLDAIDGTCVPVDSMDGSGRVARLATSAWAPKMAHSARGARQTRLLSKYGDPVPRHSRTAGYQALGNSPGFANGSRLPRRRECPAHRAGAPGGLNSVLSGDSRSRRSAVDERTLAGRHCSRPSSPGFGNRSPRLCRGHGAYGRRNARDKPGTTAVDAETLDSQ